MPAARGNPYAAQQFPSSEPAMILTPDKLVRIAPASKTYAVELVRQMAAAEIDQTPNRAAMFLSQIHVESDGWERTTENLNYSPAGLKSTFSRSRISAADADKFGRVAGRPANQNAIANIVYGGAFGKRELGNTEPGDGWRFRGRGLKQLTGRDNYRRFSIAWLRSSRLLTEPDLVAAPDGAVASAVWFWGSRALNQLADHGNVTEVTHIINGGENGLDDRQHWFAIYRSALR